MRIQVGNYRFAGNKYLRMILNQHADPYRVESTRALHICFNYSENNFLSEIKKECFPFTAIVITVTGVPDGVCSYR